MADDTQNNNGQDTMQINEQENLEMGEYQSPMLLMSGATINPSTICQKCPKSMWFQSPTSLKCYCQVMHTISYESGQTQEPILSCDGQIIAIQELQLGE